jgi:dihydrofolate reductase
MGNSGNRSNSGIVIADHSVSLDGFGAGPDVTMDNPMGDGGEGLHEWMWSAAGRTGWDGTAVEGPQALLAGAGAVVVGRRMFDLGEEPWGDPPPFHDHPVFVVTHRAHAPIVKQGGTIYTFVTDGLDATLARAREAAGDKDIVVLGGADVIQQCLRGGLLDELHLHLVHIMLGGGTRLFGNLEAASPAGFTFERTRVIDAAGVTHLRFRLVGARA